MLPLRPKKEKTDRRGRDLSPACEVNPRLADIRHIRDTVRRALSSWDYRQLRGSTTPLLILSKFSRLQLIFCGKKSTAGGSTTLDACFCRKKRGLWREESRKEIVKINFWGPKPTPNVVVACGFRTPSDEKLVRRGFAAQCPSLSSPSFLRSRWRRFTANANIAYVACVLLRIC